MKLNRISVLVMATVTLAVASCKKDKTDDTIHGKFQGQWLESSARQITLVVSEPPKGDENLPNLLLVNGATTYFFRYRLNNAGDSLYLSDLSTGGAKNVPYKIAFGEGAQSFTIKKFHTQLPNVDPLTFTKRN